MSEPMPPEGGNDEIDPAMERVRKKLVRLLFVSSGTLLIGLLAVSVAVIYRVSQMGSDEPAAAVAPLNPTLLDPKTPIAASVDAAAGDVAGVSLSGDLIALTITGDQPRVEVRRLSDGAVVATFGLSAAGAD